ncbi:MAG: class I SAM-dependent methyltransferase [Actinomycetota bacterium]
MGMRPSEGHWFEPVAEHLGAAYLRYSFTMGTDQEVEALTAMLSLAPGSRILDVGCGPGRHALAFAAAGHHVTGVDISAEFVELATTAATEAGLDDHARFVVGDARDLGAVLANDGISGGFDAAISLCQGAFGLTAGPGSRQRPERELDESILAGMVDAVAPTGMIAVSAFSAYFQLRYLEDHDSFDADSGVNHEQTVVKDTRGAELQTSLWTTCYTPRELRLLARAVGAEVRAVHGVTPGAYRPDPPSTDVPEFLLIAQSRSIG